MKILPILLVIGLFLPFGISTSFAIEMPRESSAFEVDEPNEQEKLYRYFGAACDLREKGRYEEAIEILQYILEKNPDDEYVREYLKRLKREKQKQKETWYKANKKEAKRLKRKRIRVLLRDGISFYKSGDFDKALLKFSDVLSLDSDNSTAKHYMKKLKKHYQKEIRIENLTYGNGAFPSIQAPMDKVEMEYIALSKRANKLLNQTELGYKVEEIIAAEKAKQRRREQLTLGPGDVIQISVLDHPELSGQVTVQLNGKIILPLVNDLVTAEDLTIDELTDEITKTMKRYVQKPKVSVSPIEYKSKLYYVVDEIGCTPYPITQAGFTLRDALFTADWGNNRALGRVIVMKPAKHRPIIKKVDAFDLVFRGKLEDNIRIEDGDVIYIPMTIAAKVTKTVQDLLGPFRAIRQARDNYLNLKWNEKDWRDSLRLPETYEFQAEDGKDVRLENISLRDYYVITR